MKLDPRIGLLVGDLKPNQIEVKKEYIFKNLNSSLLNCYVVNLIDEQ